MKPAVAEGLGGLVRHGEVTAGESERIVGAQDEFAGLALLGVVAAAVQHARVVAVANFAHASRTLLGCRTTDDEIGFSRAVAVDQPDAGALLESDVQIGRHAGSEAATHAMVSLLRGRLARQQDW